MSRSLKLVLGGVLVFLAVAFAAVALLTRVGEPPVGTSGPARRESPAMQVAGGVERGAEAPGSAAVPPSAGPVAKPPPIASALRDPWDTVPIVGRSRTGFSRDLQTAIAELQPEVAACFDRKVRERLGARGFTEYRGQDAADQLPDPTLMLEIEAFRDDLLVVDAPVEYRGDLSDDLLACAQHTVKGKRLALEGGTPGSRYKVRLAIAP